MSPLAALGLFLRISLVLMGLSLTDPQDLNGTVVVILNLLCADMFISNSLRDRCFDTHTVAVAALLSRPLSLWRSTGDPSESTLPMVSASVLWCFACIAVIMLTKDSSDKKMEPAIAAIVNAECALGVAMTYAPLEPIGMYASRVSSFACLSALLYLDPPSGIGERGYLMCLLPVLLAEWTAACCFSLAAVVAICWSDVRWVLGATASDTASQSQDGLI